jgi:ADP-ribose pyrophosphatase YjhB (NUDIX family)
MTELIPSIRNTARAIIIRKHKILLLKKGGGSRGVRYALPGGAQDPGETLHQALNRECLEEIGCETEIGDLIHVVDYIKVKDTNPPKCQQMVEFLFNCNVAEDYVAVNGHRPDKHQIDVIWVDLEELKHLPLYPEYLTDTILEHDTQHSHFYLGAFHD